MEDHREPTRVLQGIPGVEEGEENQERGGWMTWKMI
jgi:hypothetical protein